MAEGRKEDSTVPIGTIDTIHREESGALLRVISEAAGRRGGLGAWQLGSLSIKSPLYEAQLSPPHLISLMYLCPLLYATSNYFGK